MNPLIKTFIGICLAVILWSPCTVAAQSASRRTNPHEVYDAMKLPRWALKINMLYGGATMTPNLALEIGLGKRTSLELFGSLNMWNLDSDPVNNKKLAHYVVRPEFRWWLCERFNGHFFGVHAFFSNYNVGTYDIPLLFEKQYRYEGNAFGAGLTYGYMLTLSGRFALEFNIGVGGMYMQYRRYNCAGCETEYQLGDKIYLGPTRAGITLVFNIK